MARVRCTDCRRWVTVARIVPGYVYTCALCLVIPDYPDPVKAYRLSQNDRDTLRINRIKPEE